MCVERLGEWMDKSMDGWVNGSKQNYLVISKESCKVHFNHLYVIFVSNLFENQI